MLFFKKKKPTFKNVVWMSEEAKQNAITKLVSSISTNEVCVVFSSFADSLEDLRTYCKLNNVKTREMQSITDYSAGAILNIINANTLQERTFAKVIVSGNVHFIALEHYPVTRINDALYQAAIKAFEQSEPQVYISLDSPAMASFGSDRIKELMTRMGATDGEKIEHPMIDKSIVKALEKVDKSVRNETKANSETDWYAKNFKG